MLYLKPESPLIPEGARLSHRRAGVWVLLHYAMWVAEVPLPALYLSPSLPLRAFAALLTIALQVGIQLSGNYGTFNVLTALLALPLFASDCDPTSSAASRATTLAACLAINVIGLLHFPHNSYTTNAWPFLPDDAMVDGMRPPYLRRPIRWLLVLFRALAPWHIAHAYGVFTPRALRDCTLARRVLRIEVSQDRGATWRQLTTRFNPCASIDGVGDASDAHRGRATVDDTDQGVRSPAPSWRQARWLRLRQSLDFFAPHQPRLDHHLFYEAFEIDLQLTAQYNPYFSASAFLLPRLAQRLMEGAPEVCELLRILPTAQEEQQQAAAAAAAAAAEGGKGILHPSPHPLREGASNIRMVRSWARFATAEERRRTGALWVDVEPPPTTYGAAKVLDHFDLVADGPSAARQGRTQPSVFLPPFEELPKLEGAWASLARNRTQAQILEAVNGSSSSGSASPSTRSALENERESDDLPEIAGAIVQHSFSYVPRK